MELIKKYKFQILINFFSLLIVILFYYPSYKIGDLGASLNIFLFVIYYYPFILVCSLINSFFYKSRNEKLKRIALNLIPVIFPLFFVAIIDGSSVPILYSVLFFLVFFIIIFLLNLFFIFLYEKILKKKKWSHHNYPRWENLNILLGLLS